MNGDNFGRLLFVVGTGHENYKKNLQFIEGLDQLLSTRYPGLSKGILRRIALKETVCIIKIYLQCSYCRNRWGR
nr:stage II sporulation protein P [Sporosarcina ureae]